MEASLPPNQCSISVVSEVHTQTAVIVLLNPMCYFWSRQNERDLFLPILRFHAERTSCASEQVRIELMTSNILYCVRHINCSGYQELSDFSIEE